MSFVGLARCFGDTLPGQPPTEQNAQTRHGTFHRWRDPSTVADNSEPAKQPYPRNERQVPLRSFAMKQYLRVDPVSWFRYYEPPMRGRRYVEYLFYCCFFSV